MLEDCVKANHTSMKPLFTTLLLFLATWSDAQSTTVRNEVTGARSMTTVNAQQLHDELTALLAAQNLTATDVSALTAAFNGLPPIPTAVSDLTNDVGYTTFNGDYSSLTNAPTSVTAFSDVTDAGSGAIITDTERALLLSLSNALALIDSMSAELAIIDSISAELELIDELEARVDALEPVDCSMPVSFDGYDYATVAIGDQCWFAENLRSTHCNDGPEIPSSLSDESWAAADQTSTGGGTVYGEGSSDCAHGSCDEVANLEHFGRLYNWFAVNDERGLCPSNWHVPTDDEWKALEMELGMTAEEVETIGERGAPVGKMLRASPQHDPPGGGYGDSDPLNVGFEGLYGGRRNPDGSYQLNAYIGYYWTSTSVSIAQASMRVLSSTTDAVMRANYDKRRGYAVRCLHD